MTGGFQVLSDGGTLSVPMPAWPTAKAEKRPREPKPKPSKSRVVRSSQTAPPTVEQVIEEMRAAYEQLKQWGEQ